MKTCSNCGLTVEFEDEELCQECLIYGNHLPQHPSLFPELDEIFNIYDKIIATTVRLKDILDKISDNIRLTKALISSIPSN